ncbi:MAG TPA: thioredoxin domain-containing protein, partial [Candidatus Sulfotelmatobacter sp.]|nr:thioredoxin domain-containing protein [Candidatus Sulfotelmatobacter sp.]
MIFLAGSLAAAQTNAAPPSLAKPGEKLGTHASEGLPSEATVDSFLHQTFGYQPDLTWKIASIKPSPIAGLAEVIVVLASPQGQQSSKFYVSSDEKHALIGDLIPFGARPFDATRELLEKGITGPSKGPKDAPVTIVEFGDLQCPVCKAAQPMIEKLTADEPNARFVFQNFPLEMHNWAAKGADYADCVGKASNDAFWKFISKVYETQSDITAENADEKLLAIATGLGLKGDEISACVKSPETKKDVDASIALGKAADVTGTPSLFINGRKIGSFDPRMQDVYKALVDFAAKEK